MTTVSGSTPARTAGTPDIEVEQMSESLVSTDRSATGGGGTIAAAPPQDPGFAQGDRGNCASVAAIKLAQATFGPGLEDVFQSAQRTADGGYDITMRDGYRVQLQAYEVGLARLGADFSDGPAREAAQVMFAAMSQRARHQGLGTDSDAPGPGGTNPYRGTLVDGIGGLNDGEPARRPLDLLGLGAHVEELTTTEIQDHPLSIGVYTNPEAGHAAFIQDGQVDEWGTWGQFDDLEGGADVIDDGRGFTLQSGLTLRPPPESAEGGR